MKESPQQNRKSLALYATLQALTLVFSWAWFLAMLWSQALFGYSWGDFEWWFLMGAAFAGLYGLKPNLEKAIDTAWLKGSNNPKALAERVAQLKPIKRRIDLIFSVATLALLFFAAALWVVGVLTFGGQVTKP